jgi:4-hydroxythreonine-4-phosphate dehydrogenase
MFMVSDDIKVALLTEHVPINDVVSQITPLLVKKRIKIVEDSLKKDFNIPNPNIAILSINPHVGDNGVIGKHDDEILIPTINEIKDSGFSVAGPFASDSFFGSNLYKKYDAIMACYHDQGLIPFKTLTFGKGVNFTAGLNIVRTSPDHGTAYDISGKNVANPSSFKSAILTALNILKNRSKI